MPGVCPFAHVLLSGLKKATRYRPDPEFYLPYRFFFADILSVKNDLMPAFRRNSLNQFLEAVFFLFFGFYNQRLIMILYLYARALSQLNILDKIFRNSHRITISPFLQFCRHVLNVNIGYT